MKNSKELIKLLSLERIEENIFRGENFKAPWGQVYGGQVLAQALHAAQQTVPEDRKAHSLHAYFILGGDINVPIIYDVERIRDGGSFTTRRIVAIQKGRPIFNMAASFQLEQDGFDHQIKMPKIPSPDELCNDQELIENWKKDAPELYEYFKRYRFNRPIEFRPVEHFNPSERKKAKPYRHIWMKAKGRVPAKNKGLHQQMLTYASDYNLLGTALLPHRKDFHPGAMQLASLDHGMWFHREFKMDDWLLYSLDSPSASNARGFTRGNIFNQQGQLVASVVQDGLIRQRRKK